jgi:hypothetical protein
MNDGNKPIDENGIRVLQPPRVVSAAEAAMEGELSQFVTKREMIDGCANAAMAVAQKMYDQLSAETQTYLQQMELDIIARNDSIIAELRAELLQVQTQTDPVAVLADMASLSTVGECVLFIRPRRQLSDVENQNVEECCNFMMRRSPHQAFVLPHDFDIMAVGDAQLTKVGLMRIPEPIAEGPEA